VSDNLDNLPLDAPDAGSTETQQSDEAKQEGTEAKGKRNLYDEPAYRELQSKADRAEAQAKRVAAQLEAMQQEKRRQTIATLSPPERIAYEKSELEAELQAYKDAEQAARVEEQRMKDLKNFAKISGTPLERLLEAQTLDDAFRIAEEYTDERAKAAAEDDKEESASKVYVGGTGRSTPKTREQVRMDKALAEGDTRTYLRLVMESD
jgi:hypothetical protein